jgi:hypothetical protein
MVVCVIDVLKYSMPSLNEVCPPNLREEIKALEEKYTSSVCTGQFYLIDATHCLVNLINSNTSLASHSVLLWLSKREWINEKKESPVNPKRDDKLEGQKLSEKRKSGSARRSRQIAHENRQNAKKKRKNK